MKSQIDSSKKNRIFLSIAKFFSQLGSYLVILCGILWPMFLIFVPIFSLGFFTRISWYFIDPSLIGTNLFESWLNAYLDCDLFTNQFIFFEFLIFGIGFGLFVFSILYFSIQKQKKVGLVRTGIYKYIRHPQSLGILLMIFPFALYVPPEFSILHYFGTSDWGIRIGDLASFILILFTTVVFSKLEEKILFRLFPEEYLAYYLSSGFFCPRLRSKSKISLFSIHSNNWGFILFLFSFYLCIIGLYIMFTLVPVQYFLYY
ncbi:isoprenylcysteine carboxylmethyltransferase family protein [Candidatus Lokiarchaeum ossiferum]|uniref:isoprenylcysteine carboxylmethyltransferase family protein n=1 Tax=Candidatus Lokiarchaeum ossiferum TaxID=2951803 RepID=UPI00352D82FC